MGGLRERLLLSGLLCYGLWSSESRGPIRAYSDRKSYDGNAELSRQRPRLSFSKWILHNSTDDKRVKEEVEYFYGVIRIVPMLLDCPCALMITLQVPGARVSGSLNTTWVKSTFGTARTSAAGTSKFWLLASTRFTTTSEDRKSTRLNSSH